MEKKEFMIRPYSWKEFAMLYCEGLPPESATRRLRRWLEKNPAIEKSLTEAGWEKGDKLLTPLHVRILVNYLGEP